MKRIWLLLLAVVVVSLASCSKAEPEKTTDPAEIEELRQKHQNMAEREMADG